MTNVTATAVDVRTPETRVAMALYSDLDHDSRVLREAESLAAAGYRVTVYCLSYDGPAIEGFAVVSHRPNTTTVTPGGGGPFRSSAGSGRLRRSLQRATWMRDYIANARAWGRWIVGHAGEVQVWHAHDLPGLISIGPFIRSSSRLVYDSHEIFLETGTAARLPWPARTALALYERRLARRASALVTVNEWYASVLRKRLRPRRLAIVRNCPPRYDPGTSGPGAIRSAAGIAATDPLVLYHGALGPDRGIEQLVQACALPSMASVHLALLGFGDLDRLRIDVRSAGLDDRLHVLAAVPPTELLRWVSDADVDVMPLQPSTLNHRLCTPNKLWESLAAGVPVVVSDFPSMRAIATGDSAGPLGATCDPSQPASIAAAIRSLLDEPAEARAVMRTRCLQAAHSRWNWETEAAGLIHLYASLAENT